MCLFDVLCLTGIGPEFTVKRVSATAYGHRYVGWSAKEMEKKKRT